MEDKDHRPKNTNNNQKQEKRVRWFFDGEEHVFSKKEEDFIKEVAPIFFITDKNYLK